MKSTEPLTLGIDIGGTKILTAVVRENGEVLSRHRSATQAAKGPETVVRAVFRSIGRTLSQSSLDISGIDAVGVGIAGLSDPESGILFTSPHLPGFRDFPLKDTIEKELGKATFIINDANAAALSEFQLGAGRGTHHLIYITVSTGIGGGIIVDGQVYSGASGVAGEIGHMTIDSNGPPCSCGNNGCWETLASGTALTRQARHRIKQGTVTSILNYADNDIEKVTPEVINAAARNGDNLAQELIAETGYYLGVGLANLVNLFNPEIIIIGGGLSNIGDRLLKPAFKVAGERAFKEAYQAVRLVPAALGQNSGVLGAALFAFKKIKETTTRC